MIILGTAARPEAKFHGAKTEGPKHLCHRRQGFGRRNHLIILAKHGTKCALLTIGLGSVELDGGGHQLGDGGIGNPSSFALHHRAFRSLPDQVGGPFQRCIGIIF